MQINSINAVGANRAQASFKGYAKFNEHAINTDQIIRVWEDPQDSKKVKITTAAGTLNIKDRSKDKGISLLEKVNDVIGSAAMSKNETVDYNGKIAANWTYFHKFPNAAYDKTDIYAKAYTDDYKEI